MLTAGKGQAVDDAAPLQGGQQEDDKQRAEQQTSVQQPGQQPAEREASLSLALPPHLPARRIRLAVARDAAFCFYYHDNLALLQRAGVQLAYFSPLVDPLPHDVAGVYLGGGYPER
jgi:cobyrinic acid a,c-diamide synthase